MAPGDGFDQRMQRIEVLLKALEELSDPAVRADARELVAAILELHAAGLARIMDALTRAGNPRLRDALMSDDLVASLLLLHGYHPLDLESRVRQALEQVRPRLLVHGGSVDLLAVDHDGVQLLLTRKADAGPSSAPPHLLRQWIEEAICTYAPEVATMDFEESETAQASRVISLPIVALG